MYETPLLFNFMHFCFSTTVSHTCALQSNINSTHLFPYFLHFCVISNDVEIPLHKIIDLLLKLIELQPFVWSYLSSNSSQRSLTLLTYCNLSRWTGRKELRITASHHIITPFPLYKYWIVWIRSYNFAVNESYFALNR